MALWGKTKSEDDKPKYLKDASEYPVADAVRDYYGLSPQFDRSNVEFYDFDEDVVDSENREKGIRTPGHIYHVSYTAADGSVRNRVETLVPMKVSTLDAEDPNDGDPDPDPENS